MTVLSIQASRGGDLRLTQVLRRYDLGSSSFVGPRLFPFAPVTSRVGKIATFGQDVIIQKKTKRTDGGQVSRSNFFMGNVDYQLNNYMHDKTVPLEQIEENELDGLPFDLASIAANEALEACLLDYELDCAALATNPANYPSANTLALSGTDRWNNGASVVDQIVDAKRAALRGVNKAQAGNTRVIGIFGSKAFDAALKNTDVKAQIRPTDAGAVDSVKLASALGLNEVVEASAISVPQGVDPEVVNPTDIWDDVAIIACVPEPGANPTRTSSNPLAASNRFTPAYGYGYLMPDYPRNSKVYEHEETNSYVVRAEIQSKPILTIPAAGYLFTSVTNT